MKKGIILIVLMGILSVANFSYGQQFAGIMRDEMALGLTPTVRNWGMGGAYLGVNDITSMNPAALAFVEGYHLELTGRYASPDKGAEIYAERIDACMPFPFNSHARLMVQYYKTDGKDKTLLALPPAFGGNQDIEYDSLTLGLQLGIPITENIAIGLGAYPYERATIDLYNPITGTNTAHGEGESQIGSLQAGLMWQFSDTITFGAEYIYMIDEMEAGYPGAIFSHQADDYYIYYAAVGASWRPFKKTLLAADYRIGEIEGEAASLGLSASGGTFDVDVDRWNFGVSQEVLDWLTLRAGSNNGGFTAGLSLDIFDKFMLNYAFDAQAFRDKENIFDDVELHAVSVSAEF